MLNNTMVSEQQLKPKVLALHSRTCKMGELTPARTKFELRANPRVNRIQAALFTDKKQQISSPMFQKKPNPAIYNEAAVRAGASYIPDGGANYTSLSSHMGTRRGLAP